MARIASVMLAGQVACDAGSVDQLAGTGLGPAQSLVGSVQFVERTSVRLAAGMTMQCPFMTSPSSVQRSLRLFQYARRAGGNLSGLFGNSVWTVASRAW